MSKSIAFFGATPVRAAHRIGGSPRGPAREAMLLVLFALATMAIAISLYLVAPARLREAIVATYQGFDEPTVMDLAHPPVSP